MDELGWFPGCSREGFGFRGPLFPEKLFAAMEAPNALIQWTDDGRAICVDAEDYERNVIRVHPGLVEISSFANFRRQMREYAFDWAYRAETREFEFSHPSFVRGRPDLLADVLTRRKRRRSHGGGGGSRVGTRLRGTRCLPPARRSVISYAAVPKAESDRPRSSLRAGDVGTAKSLNEMTDEEWWTYCAPAIVLGMNGGIVDGSGGCPTTNKFSYPLRFYCDEQGSDEAVSRVPNSGLWTQKVLDFDEL